MAKYKHIDTQPRLIAVDLSGQLLPGTCEHALDHLLEHDVDLSHFDARFRNDETGAPAYPPTLLLKVGLFAYAQGIVSSRASERACQEHVTFIALCGDQAPHFTTIARFVSTLGEDIAKVFAGVLAVCDAQGLIGRELVAIDGVKLSSNASTHRSGTRIDRARSGRVLAPITTVRNWRRARVSFKATRASPRSMRGTRSSSMRTHMGRARKRRYCARSSRPCARSCTQARASPRMPAIIAKRISSTWRASTSTHSSRTTICVGGTSVSRRNTGLDHFTRRSRINVDGPWKRYCLVHNTEKLARSGYAA